MTCGPETCRLIGALSFACVAAFAATFGLIVLLRPLLAHHALARPNARSSHKTSTPQGGGIAVVLATIVVTIGTILAFPEVRVDVDHLAMVFAAVAVLGIVGAVDDIRVLEVIPRLLLQLLAVVAVVMTLPPELRALQSLPWWAERTLLVLGGLWFVNLVNFMDGIDLMTVAEVVPVTAGLAFFGLMGALPQTGMFVATILLGAIVGFSPFNRPVARLFLGDVGSLPIGLLLGWMLVLLAGNGHIAAAILLPLYYIADATITLLQRLIRGESIVKAHRDHFYQRAMDRGYGVYKIVRRVFATNIVLVGLAAATLLDSTPLFHLAMLTVGGALVGALLWNFNRSGEPSAFK